MSVDDVPGYAAGSRFGALCERYNGLVIWSKCYRDHFEYWTDLDRLNEFYAELNRADELMGGWYKDHADWRLDKVEACCEKAAQLWEVDRRRVFKRRTERNSPAYKGLASRLQKLPIVQDEEGGAFDALNAAYRILESFDYRGAEIAVKEAERKAKVLMQRLSPEHCGHKHI